MTTYRPLTPADIDRLYVEALRIIVRAERRKRRPQAWEVMALLPADQRGYRDRARVIVAMGRLHGLHGL